METFAFLTIFLLETKRYLTNFTDKEKIHAAEKASGICRGLGWTLEKDVSELPTVPNGHFDNQTYCPDNDDTLDAYFIWKATRDAGQRTIGTDLASGEESKSFDE